MTAVATRSLFKETVCIIFGETNVALTLHLGSETVEVDLDGGPIDGIVTHVSDNEDYDNTTLIIPNEVQESDDSEGRLQSS